ncbi:hypothetical protein Pcinc_031869 [Petrolisthes cinctipes]|uniref:Uncharacterized protein n=1 Tax=Petrolisthes cinctipes TaxID=88211 RepID=A0AAE1EVP3_PETCI|nr:hypothetical protein Pcinc_031869 [Petrolisthes cinctipes]
MSEGLVNTHLCPLPSASQPLLSPHKSHPSPPACASPLQPVALPFSQASPFQPVPLPSNLCLSPPACASPLLTLTVYTLTSPTTFCVPSQCLNISPHYQPISSLHPVPVAPSPIKFHSLSLILCPHLTSPYLTFDPCAPLPHPKTNHSREGGIDLVVPP